MKSNLLVCLILLLIPGSALWAAPSFWGGANGTPTPPAAPFVEQTEESPAALTATPTPVMIKINSVSFPTATPTPLPGMVSKDSTTAALFSTVIPGAGQFYDGDPLRGLAFAALFGVGLWQTIDNLQLVPGTSNVKNEDAGELIGLGTLAVYGFGIQDAANGANNYNRRNNLALTFQLKPRSGAQLALRF